MRKKYEKNNRNIFIFLIATYGEGDPTDNCREFYENCI